MIAWIGVVPHHLQSLLGAIKLTFCVHSYIEYDILMLKLGRLYCTSMLPCWENVISYMHGIKLAFSLFPLLHLCKILHKIQATHSGRYNLFSSIPYIYLTIIVVNHDQHTANGLTFMPEPGYGHYFYFLLFYIPYYK